MQVTYCNFDWILGVNKTFYGSLASFLEVESQVRDLLRMTLAGSAGSGDPTAWAADRHLLRTSGSSQDLKRISTSEPETGWTHCFVKDITRSCSESSVKLC